MFRRLSDFAKTVLFAGFFIVPGLGTVDFCLAQQRICHESKANSCCCPIEESGNSEVPCCVTIYQDWIVPIKAGTVKFPIPEFAGIKEVPIEGKNLSHLHSEVCPGIASPDPPPWRLTTFLALIRVRLI